MSRPVRVAIVGAVALAFGAQTAGAQTNIISTVAGTGTAGFTGDGGPAGVAQLAIPIGVSITPDGGYLIADQANNRVRRVSPGGRITTVAGSGPAGFSGDNGPATSAQLNAPSGAAMSADGRILIADANNNRIRQVSPGGTITTVVGTGAATFNGDGIAASAAAVNFPFDVVFMPDGSYLIADVDNNRVRRVAAGGTISTVAGTGAEGAGGDGGPATAAQLADPSRVALTADGGFLIADVLNHRIRRVSLGGTITTVAGTGTAGFSGDGGPATQAALNGPAGIAVTPGGDFLIGDRLNHRVRRVSPDGTITTIAGTGTAADGGDGGPATQASLNTPFGLAVSGEGDYLIADALNHRVRFVDAAAPPPPPPPPPNGLTPPVLGRTFNVRPVSGDVFVSVPVRAAASVPGLKGRRFVPLEQARQVPIGSLLDTRKGRVRLTSARNRTGATQSGDFLGGVFQTLQSRRRRAKGLTEVALKGSSFKRCAPVGRGKRRGRRSGVRGRGAARRTIRRLRGSANGRFRTRGRRSSATVRGTIWTVTDRCDGTLTTVKRGKVAVRDFRAKKTIVVRAGKQYLAKERRP